MKCFSFYFGFVLFKKWMWMYLVLYWPAIWFSNRFRNVFFLSFHEKLNLNRKKYPMKKRKNWLEHVEQLEWRWENLFCFLFGIGIINNNHTSLSLVSLIPFLFSVFFFKPHWREKKMFCNQNVLRSGSVHSTVKSTEKKEK